MKKKGRILGLDVGDKTIGIAISDPLFMTAQGISTVYRKSMREDIEALEDIIKKYNISLIICGFPKRVDGSIGEQAIKVKDFSSEIEAYFKIPVILWDERFSTSSATRTLLEADLSRRKRKKVINKLAAVIILQNYLDYQFLNKQNS
ncbi:MAG: Holliday junction resolvase RuvX [Deltaproteobacteria bacterium]|nr:Holliday junction resolvase RuvX [Deltaproteobacteria bacterium]RLA88347.1 MAG: Holliday junction resolvase RuvX [Deltaproteobacteria bacterium]